MYTAKIGRAFPLLLLSSVLSLLLASCFEGNPIFGPPLTGNDVTQQEWQWHNIEGSMCRDGSPTGIGLKVKDPKRLVIYLNGGGACFNELTCQSNRASFNEQDFLDLGNSNPGGIFDQTRLENPVREWSMMFVPYCTGDVHMGSRYNGRALDLDENQAYVGAYNFEKALTFIEPYFLENEIEEVLLFGISAGGYGIYTNFLKVKRHFPNAKLTVINDSGPLFDDPQAFSPCLQLGFIVAFGVQVPPNFLNFTTLQDGLSHVYAYSSANYPNDNFGFISSLEDETSRFFLSFGYNNCTGAPNNSIPADEFRSSLISLRDDVIIPDSDWSTYYIDNSSHTQLNDNGPFYEHEVEGMKLYEWLARLILGERRVHVTAE